MLNMRTKRLLFVAFTCLVISGCSTLLVAKDDRYATPEKTWETYREAIFNGDTEAALDCFAEYARDRERRRLFDRVVGIKGMQKRIKPIIKIELANSGVSDQHGLHLPVEYRVYGVITERGASDRTIFFVKIGDDWKIESLPF